MSRFSSNTIVKRLNSAYHTNIRWDGRDTRGMYHWIAYGNSYEDIWNVTVEARVNDFDDRIDYVRSLGVLDGLDPESEELIDAVYAVDLTDAQYREMIEQSRGNAYYSTFMHWNGDEWEGEE